MTPPIALFLALAAATSGGKPAAAPALAAGQGQVSYVTAKDVYLDVGRARGLVRGASVQVFRRNRPLGTCEVVDVTAREAWCRPSRAGVGRGDRVEFVPAPPPDAPPAPAATTREPPPSVEDVTARRTIVRAAPIVKVPFKKTGAAPAIAARASAMLRQEVWAITTAPDATFARTSLDGSARARLTGAPHVFASGALRLVGDVVAPPEQRFRPGELAELYVWNASLGIDEGPVLAEVGRFRPRLVPGALVLDGAQVGTRFLDARAEVGGYAGVVPDLLTLAPRLDVLTAGLYVGGDFAFGRSVLVLPRARAAVLATTDFATVRGELEAQTQVFWKAIGSVGGSARAGLGGTPDSLPSLDAAHVDGEVRVTESVQLAGVYRYLARPAVDFDLATAVPPVRGAHHASTTATFSFWSWLTFRTTAGLSHDLVGAIPRGYLGPEVGLPRAFGAIGGLEAGYLAELGDASGCSAWIATTMTPWSSWRWTTRVSYFETLALGDPLRETGLTTSLDAPLLPWLALRGRAYVAQGLPSYGLRDLPTILTGDLGISGSL